MSPNSDIHSNSNGPPTGCPPGSDINVDEIKLTKELFDKLMVLDNSSVDANEVNFEEHLPFDSSCYPDTTNTSLYTRPPFSLPRSRTHD